MKDADCPDKLCEKTGKISKNGETIVRLPHRVVVEIQGGEAQCRFACQIDENG